MKSLIQIFELFLLLLSYLVPRNSKIILYADNNLNNSIYLFRYAARQKDNIRHVYLTPYPEVQAALNEQGLEALPRWSFTAVYLAFRAGCYVISSSPGQINNKLSRHACIVNLWHGISIKEIGMMGLSPKKQAQKRVKYAPYRMIPSTSPSTQECFCKAFGKDKSLVPILGEPRNDILFRHKGIRNTDFLKRYVDKDISGFNKIVGFLPTWRDYGDWDAGFDFDRTNDFLINHNALLIIKPHPKDISFNHLKNQSNIYVVKRAEGWQDAFEILVGMDILITDYSSVAYEYMLMERPIILYTPDFERYTKDRPFWIDYDLYAPEDRIDNESQLLERIDYYLSDGELPASYFKALDRLHTFKDGNSSKRIYQAMLDCLK